MEEYLTINELSARIKFSRQSLYNLIYKRIFVLGHHYLKPSPKKVLFKWSAIQAWMGESSSKNEINAPKSVDESEINVNFSSICRNESKNLIII